MIAGNFRIRGRKLSRMDVIKWQFSRVAVKSRNSWIFSPSRVSRYTDHLKELMARTPCSRREKLITSFMVLSVSDKRTKTMVGAVKIIQITRITELNKMTSRLRSFFFCLSCCKWPLNFVTLSWSLDIMKYIISFQESDLSIQWYSWKAQTAALCTGRKCTVTVRSV